jgi:DNA-binding ferritin-like protein
MILQLLDIEDNISESNLHKESTAMPDVSIFNQFANNDPEALKKIITSLANGLNDTSQALEVAAETKDYLTISLLAHRILPNLRNLKANETVTKLLELENLRNTENPENENIDETLASTVLELKIIENNLRKLI